MPYCTVEDVCGELHPTLHAQMLKDWNKRHTDDPTKLDFNQTIETHITKAEAFVNASLARAFSVPVRKRSTIVLSAACKIAAYYACAAYSEMESILKDKYETAVEMLDNLVKAGVIPDEDGVVEEVLPLGVLYGSNPQIFTADELSRW